MADEKAEQRVATPAFLVRPRKENGNLSYWWARQDNRTVMGGGIPVGIVDFAVLLFGFDCACCASFRLFLVRNWCDPSFDRNITDRERISEGGSAMRDVVHDFGQQICPWPLQGRTS
ncbi:hypothetical protein [Bradyrhizobium sp. LMG 9283]|uniref:hypothetical protein n=1 Tax=Bradyrhizobium sp. LMG 9283 TaxID=592064 RepID=UPI00388F8860